MKRTVAMMLVVIMGAVASAVMAQGRGGQSPMHMGGPGGHGPGGLMPMLHQLNLTDAQKEQVRALMEDSRPTDPPQIPQLEHKLHLAVLSGDSAAVETLKTQLNDAHAQMLNHQVEMLQRLAQILTSEQKQKLAQMHPGGPGGH